MLEELADFLGMRAQVAEITKRAMNGEIEFVGALTERVAMLRAFDDSMTTGRASETDGAEGRRDLAVVLAAYRSIAEGCPVTPGC